MAAATPREAHGRIDRIELCDFKSYRGNHVIGPFRNFTAIVGPNGSGKSNLMDAISFVLGVKSSQLRGAALKDLVYNGDGGNSGQTSKSFVRLAYEMADGKEVHFTRIINAQGTSEYKIDNRTVGWEAYSERLKSFGIMTKARNSLVFQGDIESIAAKGPKELTQLIEQISGSEAFKKEFEELEASKIRAEEKTSFAFTKRKGLQVERKQKQEQKNEAERYQRLQEDLKALKAEYFLWQIFHQQEDMNKAESEVLKLNEELEELSTTEGLIQKEIEQKKKAKAKSHKEVLVVEKKLALKKKEIDKKKPEEVKVKEEIQRANKRLKTGEKNLEKMKQEAEQQETDKQKLRQDLENVVAAKEEFEEQLKQAAKEDESLKLLDSQLGEYNKLKEQAGAKTFKIKQDLATKDRDHQADNGLRLSLEENVRELDSRIQQLEAQLEESKARGEKLLNSRTEAEEQLSSAKKEKEQLVEKARRDLARKEHVQQKLDEIEGSLREAKYDKKEHERDSRMREAVGALKRLMPGVHGRVFDLCKVRQRKYNLAVSVVMGKNMDAVVTNDEKTAKECIRYLKEQRIPPMTFLPLATILTKPVNERLRTLGGTSRLVLDVLDYDPQYERAMIYACGGTVVCDRIEEAKRLGFSGPERLKVVSTDGTLIHKSGMITGGVTGGLEARASRFNAQAVEGIQQERARYTKELQEISGGRVVQVQEQELNTRIDGLEKKIQYIEVDHKVTQEKIEKVKGEVITLKEERKKLLPELNKVRQAIAAREQEMQALRKVMNEETDKVFSGFSRSVGVQNIREYEENQLRRAEETAKQRMTFNTHIAKLKNQLQFEENRDTSRKVREAEDKIQKDTELLMKLQKREEDLHLASSKDLQDLEIFKKDANSARSRMEELDLEIKELGKRSHGQTQEVGKIKKKLSVKETETEQYRSRIKDVLQTSELEQVELPTSSGSQFVPMQVDNEEEAPFTVPELDYSRVPRSKQSQLTDKERARVDEEYRLEIEEKAASLAKAAPNMKAAEQFEHVKEKESEVLEELDTAKNDAKLIAEQFFAKRQERLGLFTDAFNHISSVIDPIYKELTKSPTHPLGGTAYLSLENPDEPFLHGIKYTAMPPTKRFRDMEQLSGGEKTVAALALLFAIHSFKPTPFFVLDEVDAALDNINVGKVASYIRGRTREGADIPFQSIVISLKDTFFDKADALVGVCRDSELLSSRTLTFDLNKYGSAA
uniref:Structural maintenance of chromosomes protein n=1 Tax=Picocystis salinarum TaxID=88271 RepID=A0A6U9R7I1_9CHLO